MNIESLEGWQSLLDKRDKVDGDPEKIRSIAAAWRTASDLTDYTDDVAAAVRDVDNAWHGQSADAFVSYMGRFSTAGQGLSAALSTCASNLSDVAQALEDAKSSIDTIISNTRTAASEYATNHPDATDEQLRSHFTSLLTTANNDAQEHLDNAKTAVSDATTAITGSIDGDYTTQTGSFNTIPDPASQEFTPRKGIPFDWKPTPGYQPPTDPAGYTPTGYNPNGYTPTGYTPTTSYAAYTGGTPIPYVIGDGTGADIVNAARQHLGKPYIWGANGPNAFDCSGLVYYVLNQAGIKIGDNTAAGYQMSGKPISGPPQPGDIVFFGQPPTHCGIYIGDGKMIHAPHSGAVVEIDNVAGRSPITFRRFTA